MRRLSAGLTLFFVLLLGRVPRGADDLLLGHFGEYLEALRAQVGIPGLSAAIVGDNDILWERAFGQADLDRNLATAPDTPFHLDNLTEVVTSALVLRCVEEGRLSLDDQVGKFWPDSPDADATLRQLLSHTSGPGDNLQFVYRPERLAPLGAAIEACSGRKFRRAVADRLEQLAMMTSVPGVDSASFTAAADVSDDNTPDLTFAMVSQYGKVLERLAKPYAVDKHGHASVSEYAAPVLTPSSGLVSTTRDLAQFDLALRQGILLRPDTLAAAWRAPLDRNGQPLPHGLGWFVQTYNHEPVVWQFGVEDNAASSMMLTVPGRSLTLILLANSDGLVKPFDLAKGDITRSPFAQLFLGLFVRS